MEVFGVSADIVVAVLVLLGWVVLMRFILPRLGVST
jgi:hypothetical protein